jgi:hypothetical protein
MTGTTQHPIRQLAGERLAFADRGSGSACARRGHTAFPDCHPLGAACNIETRPVPRDIPRSDRARDGYRQLGIVRNQ